MRSRVTPEEDPGCVAVDISINPLSPSVQSSLICFCNFQFAIHMIAFLEIVLPESKTKKKLYLCIEG